LKRLIAFAEKLLAKRLKNLKPIGNFVSSFNEPLKLSPKRHGVSLMNSNSCGLKSIGSVAGIGSVLRHDYHTIADKVIWDVVQVDLPLLRTAVEAIAATVKE